MDHLDSPAHIHGWYRNNHRSRDRRRTRRELRACPEVTRRHLDLFVALYEDTIWVNEADIEREIATDTGRDDDSTHDENLTAPNPDELWTTERRNTTTREREIIDAAPSTSTSTGADTKTQKDPIVSGQDQRLTAHDEIMTIMMGRLSVTTNEDNNTNTIPSTDTNITPSPSTSIAAGTSTQPKPEAAGEEFAQKEHRPELMSLLDWFLTNKEK